MNYLRGRQRLDLIGLYQDLWYNKLNNYLSIRDFESEE